MPLTDTNIPFSLNTSRHKPVDDLFIPALKNATRFDVAVGYFTSGWLKDTAEGIAEFALSGGVSRWLISPVLQEDDAKSIIGDLTNKKKMPEIYQERDLMEVIKSLENDARGELCALVASGVLEFRIAIPKDFSQGMFHAKIGVFNDVNGNKLGFSGSYNFTSAAKSNWERIDVYKDWVDGEAERVVSLDDEFNDLWTNKDPKYVVIEPSSELINSIKALADPDLFKALIDKNEKKKEKRSLKLRGYQEEAIEAWGREGPGDTKNGHGTYVMATGSGKTITALATIEKLISKVVEDRSLPLMIVIVLPLKHLLDQWYEEALEFGFEPIKCYESSSIWRRELSERLSIQKITGSGYVMAMVTNSTLAGEIFQAELYKIKTNFLFVADEAHNLGSSTYLKALPDNANFRLALSATPDRYNDISGTKNLFKYFGDPVIDFPLEDAIQKKFLCPYEYFPHLCPMSESEYEEYNDITDQIKFERNKLIDDSDYSKELVRLQGKRNDLITGVVSKLDILKTQLKNQIDRGSISHTLIYCGMRRGEDELRHIERTVKLVGKLGIKIRKFTADETLDERRDILSLFSSGDLEAIAAIKCLDEGVDVPATRVAYILASTANPREFIQRRGRVLRKSEGKEKAIIHDFLVAPPYKRNDNDNMVERELERGYEFARLSLNSEFGMSKLKEFSEIFGVEEWT